MLCKFTPVNVKNKFERTYQRPFIKSICCKELHSSYIATRAIYQYIYNLGHDPEMIRLYPDKKSLVRCEKYINGVWTLIFNIKILSSKSSLYCGI